MATVWEQIQEKRTKVEEFQGTFQTARTKFAADGEIDADEQAKLDKITSSLNAAKAKVKELESEFKANKAKWEGRDGDYQNLKKQYDELDDWEDPICPNLKKTLNEAGKNSRAMAWLDAIAELDKGIALVKAPYQEYQKQKPFEEQYNERHDKIRERGDDKTRHRFAKKEDIAQSLSTFETLMTSAASAAENRKYDDGCRFLDNAESTVGDVETEIKDLTEKHDQVSKELASVQGDAALYAASKYKTVQALNQKMAEFESRIAGHVAAYEYDFALSVLEITRNALNEMKAEQEKQEKQEGDWDKKQTDVQAAQEKAEEVKEYSGVDVGKTVEEAGKAASEQNYEEATEQAEQGAAEAEAAHQEMQKKKAERSSKLDDIQKQVADMLAELAD